MTSADSAEFEGWPSVLMAISDGVDLEANRVGGALREILAGSATASQIAAFMVAIKRVSVASELRGLYA